MARYKMHKFMLFLYLFLFMALLLSACEPDTVETSFRVSGTVYDQTGDGVLEGVDILLYGEETGGTVTDEQGFWEIIVHGPTQVSPWMEGYIFEPEKIHVTEERNDVDFYGTPEEEYIELYDHVSFFDREAAQTITNIHYDDDGEPLEVLFSERIPQVEELQVGDILMADPTSEFPHGLLARITGISEDGLELQTEYASLEEVIKHGTLHITQSIPVEEFMDHLELISGSAVEKSESGFRIPFDQVIDGIHITGNLEMVSDLEIDIDMSFRRGLDDFSFVFTVALDTDLEIQTLMDGNPHGRLVLARRELGDIPIFGPVSATPAIEFVVGSRGETTANARVHGEWQYHMEAGLEYSQGSGWSILNEHSGSGFHVSQPALGTGVDLETYAGVEVSLLAMRSVGVSGALHPSLCFTGTSYPSPHAWDYALDFALDGSFGANLRLWRIADLRYELASRRFLENNIAYGISGIVMDDDETPLENAEINFDEGIGTVFTDANGIFRSPNLKDAVQLLPYKEHYEFDPEYATVSQPRSDVHFTGSLVEYTARGTVQTSTGQPISGIEIQFCHPYTPVITDTHGAWEKEGLEGSVEVRPFLPTYEFNPMSKRVCSQDPMANFTLLASLKEVIINPTKDTYVDPYDEDRNFGNTTELWVNSSETDGYGNRVYIYFPYTLSPGTFIAEAELTMHQVSLEGEGPGYIRAHRILNSWDENTVTWNTRPGITGWYDSQLYDTHSNILHWDVTDILIDWREGSANHGIALTGSAHNFGVGLGSRHTSSPASLRVLYLSRD